MPRAEATDHVRDADAEDAAECETGILERVRSLIRLDAETNNAVGTAASVRSAADRGGGTGEW
jgi:hypothetical protein